MRDNKEPITILTAYDFPTAKKVNDAGIDMILVGDSCAMVVHGHPNSLIATRHMMVPHCAVTRACDRTMVIADVLCMFDSFTPSFAKRYQKFGEIMIETFKTYKEEVISGTFPGEEHSYKMSDEVLESIMKEFEDA